MKNDKEESKAKEEESDFAELEIIQKSKHSLEIAIAILCASLFFAFAIVVERIYKKVNDNSVISVECNKDFQQNKPVLLTNTNRSDLKQIDNRLKQFVQDILFSMYPRFVEDIESHYQNVVNHSKEGSYIYDDYHQRLENIDHFKFQMRNKKYTKLYFDKKEFKIRKPQAKNRVQKELFKNRLEVLIDGYMHMHNGINTKMNNPSILLTIEFVPSTITNPEGIEIISFRGQQLIDPITGKIELI